jgi:hypothetical protein
MPPNDRAACSGNIPFRNGRAAREKAQLQDSAGQACAYFYCGRSRSANGGTRAQQRRGAPTRCKLRQAAPKRNHRARGAPAYAFRDALPIGQSNGRKAASPVREMSCLRASPRERMRRVPRERLSLVHQRQSDTGAVKATPHTMARATATPASTVTGGYSPSTCRR